MTVTVEDISIVLSGGINNLDPNLSLGGDPSTTPVRDNLINNLFSDVTPDQAEDGYEDYRCFYFFNDGDSTIYNIEVWIESQVEDGASIELGIEETDELQRITLSGAIPTSGTATWAYEGEEFTTGVFTDLAEAALFFQDAFNSLVDDDGNKLLETVEVTTPSNLGSPTIIFDVLFTGNDGKRNHSLVELVEDAYTPTQVTFTVTVAQEGAPVNTIAAEIANEATTPAGVNFYAPSQQSPITVYKLKPAEGFPIWVRRTTPTGQESVANDGAVLRFRVETLEP